MNKSGSASIKDHLKKLLSNYFSAETPFVLGVSGGPDSMALMYLFHQLGVKSLIVHINYGKRGQASDRDQELVEGMAFEWGFDCHSLRLEAPSPERGNFQNQARNERYQIFRALKDEFDAQAVVTAHHQDDQLETILQKLLRGSGVPAWKGMEIWNGELFRPLLPFPKEAIMEYCEQECIPFYTDESNLSSEYARNFIRHELSAKLDEFFPGWKQNILSLPDRARITDEALQHLVQDSSEGSSLKVKALENFSEELQMSVLKRFLENRGVEGISKGQLEELSEAVNLETGKLIELGERGRLIRDRDRLILDLPGNFFSEKKLSRKQLESGFSAGYLTLRIDTNRRDPDLFMDAGRMNFPLVLRRWQEGDRFTPFGMSGSQKISDHLTNRKVSAARKKDALVLCGTDGTIYALFFPEGQGGSISELVRCTEQTVSFLTVNFRTAL